MGRRVRRWGTLPAVPRPRHGEMVPGRRNRLTIRNRLDVPRYTELHTASAFSFLDGASLPEALIERAASLGYPALALLDRDGVYGARRFHLAAKKAGIKAIVGAELTIHGARRAPRTADGTFQTVADGGGDRASRLAPRTSHLAPHASDAIFRLPVL